jgi:hypothetical protein
VKLHIQLLFFFVKTLKRPYLLGDIPYPKVPRRAADNSDGRKVTWDVSRIAPRTGD